MSPWLVNWQNSCLSPTQKAVAQPVGGEKKKATYEDEGHYDTITSFIKKIIFRSLSSLGLC